MLHRSLTRTIALGICVGVLSWSAAIAQERSGPVGFASLDGGTPGGDPKNVCKVTTPDQRGFRTAIECTARSPKGGVVTFAPSARTITLTRRVDLPSNITIKGPATIQSQAASILRIAGVRNVIITDITFKTIPGGQSKKGRACPDPASANTIAVGSEEEPGTTGCTVPITIQGTRERKARISASNVNASNVWIDHNTFLRCGDKCITIKNGAKRPDGQFTGADNITISNNKFQHSFFGILMTLTNRDEGGARNLVLHKMEACRRLIAAGSLPRMRATLYGNLFDHVRRRMMRVAHCTSYGHEFNNVIIGFGLPMSSFGKGATCKTRGARGFGPSAHSGARLLVENNYIAAWPNDPKGCKAAVLTESKGGAEGYVKETGNLYVNGAFGSSNKPEMVTPPPYRYQLMPTPQVYKSVTENAGARTR